MVPACLHFNQGDHMKYQVITFRHYGVPFINNENATLLCTGMFNHTILVRTEM